MKMTIISSCKELGQIRDSNQQPAVQVLHTGLQQLNITIRKLPVLLHWLPKKPLVQEQKFFPEQVPPFWQKSDGQRSETLRGKDNLLQYVTKKLDLQMTYLIFQQISCSFSFCGNYFLFYLCTKQHFLIFFKVFSIIPKIFNMTSDTSTLSSANDFE